MVNYMMTMREKVIEYKEREGDRGSGGFFRPMYLGIFCVCNR
jgi:hypothetical protein